MVPSPIFIGILVPPKGRDLSDHLLDCRRSLPHCLFRVDVRGVVWVAPEARLAPKDFRAVKF